MKLLKFNTLKLIIYLIISFLVIVGVSLGALWFYANKMSTKKGNINVTKMVKINKIYSYSVFGDFYYRAIEYDNESKKSGQYSSLIPIRVNIGYDFSNNPPEQIFRTEYAGEAMIPTDSDKNSPELENFVNILDDFAKTYGELVVSQDNYYFNEAQKAASNIVSIMYDNVTYELKPLDTNILYESEQKVPVDNLIIKPYKLNYINANLKDFIVCEEQWCPNLATWIFNDNDRIYLQYLKHASTINLSDYINEQSSNGLFKDSIVIKTVKPAQDKVEPIFLVAYLPDNKIKSYVMDNNGYIYIVILSTQNKNSLFNSLEDYLKIVYGINFKPVKNFENNFVNIQEEYEDIAKSIFSNLIVLNRIITSNDIRLQPLILSELEKEYPHFNFLYNYFEKYKRKLTKEYYNLIINKNIEMMKAISSFDVKEAFKKNIEQYKVAREGIVSVLNLIDFVPIYFAEDLKKEIGTYPNNSMVEELEKLNIKTLEYMAVIDEAKSKISWYTIDKVGVITKYCDNITCIEERNKLKRWEDDK